jgi:hypothetical protein
MGIEQTQIRVDVFLVADGQNGIGWCGVGDICIKRAAFSSTVSRALFPERVLNPLHGRRKVIGNTAPKKMDGMALVAHQASVDDVLVATDAKARAVRHGAFVRQLPPEKVRDVHHPLPDRRQDAG